MAHVVSEKPLRVQISFSRNALRAVNGYLPDDSEDVKPTK
jgi:hypothetical protein